MAENGTAMRWSGGRHGAEALAVWTGLPAEVVGWKRRGASPTLHLGPMIVRPCQWIVRYDDHWDVMSPRDLRTEFDYSGAGDFVQLHPKRGGVVYVIEYADRTVKVGSSGRPWYRRNQLDNYMSWIGGADSVKLWYTEWHTRFRENERAALAILREDFANTSAGTEFFVGLRFAQAVKVVEDVCGTAIAGAA